jgi:hypothetical protein
MDVRPDPGTPAPDAFGEMLRGLLLEQSRRAPVPEGLTALVDLVIAGAPARQRASSARWPRALATLAASLALIVATGLLLRTSPVARWAWGDGDDAGPAVVWDSGAVRLEADSIRIVGFDTFTATPDIVDGSPAIAIGSDPGDASSRTLEVEWRERGVPMRLYLYFAADDTHWWVTEMRTYDGSSLGGWIHYLGPLFRTPLGGTYADDVVATGGRGAVPGSVRIDGLRLTAFAPGTGPASRTGCRAWPTEPGQRLDLQPDDLVGMVPGQAATRLRGRGFCYEFRWDYQTGPGSGFSERWCVPPPTGRVTAVSFLDDGTALLSVSDDSGLVREVRDQPPAGWGCPTDQRGAADASPGSNTGAREPTPSDVGSIPVGPPIVTVEAEVPASPAP